MSQLLARTHAPTVDNGGTIYYNAWRTGLYAVSPAGQVLWSYTDDPKSLQPGSAAIGGNEALIINNSYYDPYEPQEDLWGKVIVFGEICGLWLCCSAILSRL
jgi:hypothetical protein